MRRKRYAALFMAAVTACTQVAGTGVVAMADEIIVEEELQEYAGEAEETALTADMQQADEAAALEDQDDAMIPSDGEIAAEPDDVMIPSDGEIAAEPDDTTAPAGGEIAAEPDDAMTPSDGEIAAEPDDAVAPADGAIAAGPNGAVTAEQPDDVLPADELNIDGSDLLMSVEEIDGAEMEELDLAAGEEVVEEYDYWSSVDGATLMPGWTRNIEMWYWHQDAEYPDGEETTLPVTDVVVKDWDDTVVNEDDTTGNWVDTDGTIITVEGNQQDGWMLRGEGIGRALVTLTYTPVREDDPGTYEFEVIGGGDLYIYEWMPQDSARMLTNDSLTVSGRLSHEWYHNEENCGFEWVEEYSLEPDPERGYDTELVTANITEDGKGLVLTSNGNGRDGSTDVWINVKCKEDPVTDARFHVDVSDDSGYFAIVPQEYDSSLPIGGSFDLNLGTTEEPGAHVYRYYRENGELKSEPVQQDISFLYEYDDAWQETGESGSNGLPVLQRTGDWDTEVTLIAQMNMAAEGEEEDWQEICRYPYRFDSLDYGIWFDGENIRNENGDGTWIYNTEDLVLNVNTENLADKQSDDIKLTYEYKVGICEDGRDGYVRELSGAAVTANGSSVTLHGAQIWQELAGTELSENQWMDVSVQVYANGVPAASCGLGFDVREPFYDYQYQYDGISRLPGWDLWVDRIFSCYVESKEHPRGENVDVEVTNLSVENAEDEESELPVCMIDGSDENGWNIHANQNTCGHAVATVMYKPVEGSGDSGSYEFDIWVGGDVFSMNLWSDSVSDQLLPGESLQMTAQVWHDYYDNENGHNSGDVDDEKMGADVEIEWLISVDSGRSNQNEDGSVTWYDYADDGKEYPVLTLKPDGNGRTCTVTAAEMLPEEWGEYGVCVEAHAHVPNAEAEGGREELAANDCWITVSNGYWQLMQKAEEGQEEPLQNMLPCDLVVNDPVNLNPVLTFISQSGDQRDTEGLRYRLEWDQDAVQIMAEGGESGSEKLSYDAETEDAAYSAASGFTVTRQNRYETYLNLIAELPELNENGEQVLNEDGSECYYEAARCEWQLDELDYNIWFEELRSDGNTWVFSDEEYALELNVSNVADRLADGKYALDVTVGVYEEAENGAKLVEKFAADTAEAAGCYQISGPNEKGIVTVKLHGATLAKKVYGDDLQGSGLPEGQWLEFHASLLGIENAETNDREPLCYDDGTPIDAGTGLGVLKPMLRLEDAEPEYMWMLLGGGYEFGGTADKPTVLIYPQNQKYPHGDKAFEASVSAIEITNPKNEDGSEIEVLKEFVLEENGAKFLYANECGQSRMMLTLSCPELSQEEIQMELDVEVGDRGYDVNLESSTGTENLLKGASLELLTSVYLLDGNAEGENRYRKLTSEAYSIEYCDYDPNLIQVKDGVVTAVPKETNADYYGTDVRVQVSIPQGDGAEDWVEDRWFHIEVCERYCVLQASPLMAGAGDTLTPDQFEPKLYMVNEVHPEVTEDSEPLKNAGFWFEDSSDWDVAALDDARENCNLVTAQQPDDEIETVQIHIGGSYMDAYGERYEGYGAADLTVCAHRIQKTEAVEPTCTEAGNIGYFHCAKCDRYFSDEACTKELDPDSLKLAAKGHTLAKVDAKPATCTEAGNVEYYHCSVCNKNYKDAAGTKELSDVAVAAAHKLTKVSAKPATCTEAGNAEYYHCSVCNKNYSDAAGTKELSDVTVAAGHKLTHVAATADTVEHYHCPVCGKNFSDASGASELTSTAAPAKPHVHTWGDWETVSAATVFAPEKQQHTCAACGVTETQDIGTALTPTMTVPANSLKMRVKQSTKKFVVTNMAEGDSVASMVSSSTKRLKVVSFNADGTCTLKAGKKTGKAKLTITLASGLTKTVTFKIQKSKVKTTSVKLAEKKLTLKKGEKLSLKPQIRPITSQDKVKYTSSNKKIVTVSSKGKLTAKKAGKAKITIRSGKKKVVCTVTVTK